MKRMGLFTAFVVVSIFWWAVFTVRYYYNTISELLTIFWGMVEEGVGVSMAFRAVFLNDSSLFDPVSEPLRLELR
jgi:hypothetical protein